MGTRRRPGATGSTGATGATGPAGATGNDGNLSAQCFDYNYSSSIIESDPGGGTIRLNTLAVDSATEIYIDYVDVNSDYVMVAISLVATKSQLNVQAKNVD